MNRMGLVIFIVLNFELWWFVFVNYRKPFFPSSLWPLTSRSHRFTNHFDIECCRIFYLVYKWSSYPSLTFLCIIITQLILTGWNHYIVIFPHLSPFPNHWMFVFTFFCPSQLCQPRDFLNFSTDEDLDFSFFIVNFYVSPLF